MIYVVLNICIYIGPVGIFSEISPQNPITNFEYRKRHWDQGFKV